MASREESPERDYSQWPNERLQNQLEESDSQITALEARFPGHRSFDLGARFGCLTDSNQLPPWYREIQRWRRQRAEVAAELSKRGKLRQPRAAICERPVSQIGNNIDALRKECGWSFDELASKTGIDKKLILSHVNRGAKPTPRILKEYAEAFTKTLGRRIIAPDLEK